jgi:hypothetical protein
MRFEFETGNRLIFEFFKKGNIARASASNDVSMHLALLHLTVSHMVENIPCNHLSMNGPGIHMCSLRLLKNKE